MVHDKFLDLIEKFVKQNNGYKKELEKMHNDGKISEKEWAFIDFHVSARKVLDKLDVLKENLANNYSN